jgi:outer membrane protein assembly factor BamB
MHAPEKAPQSTARAATAAATVLVLAAALAAGTAASAGAVAADWPQFRGPHRDGISAETGLATRWPDGGPAVLWRTPLGEGYSGLSVVGGRLFTLFSDDRDELVVALDAATGKELWRFRLDGKYSDGQGNGPRSTPTVDDGVVYALGARGRLAALDAATGKPKWNQDLKATFGARVPTWGVATSPLVEGDLLLLDVGGRPGAALVALHKRNGVVAWTSETDRAGYAAPITVTIAGRRQVIFFTGSRLVGVALEDGRPLWDVGWSTSYDVNAATPIFIAPDQVFIASGYDTGAALFKIGGDGQTLRATEVWRTRGMKNQFSSSIYKDGYLYGFDNAILRCLDAKNGEEQWKARGFGHGSLTYADGHLIVLGDRGNLALVEATPAEYREKATAQALTGKCWTVPTFADGRLFLRNEREVVALDVAGETGASREAK